ncbi:hypothetical protein BD310DRAFT_936365 [Dichomitus squalens]|uniref:Uncharacterized protein n=1 Tax=Dichomitus squalens TaxID=114155 RepID=A0A4Q9PJI9_9APHY|nr:hypothetical protein BD310DRAFT_936365 [Dichomitus squalens]
MLGVDRTTDLSYIPGYSVVSHVCVILSFILLVAVPLRATSSILRLKLLVRTSPLPVV